MEPISQLSGIAGTQSKLAPMGANNQRTLLKAPASILKNIKNLNNKSNFPISGQIVPPGSNNLPQKQQIPSLVICRNRLDSTASQSVISTIDDSISEHNNKNEETASCSKSMHTFIKEPPQPMKDPCCRIKEPSCCRARACTFNPEDGNDSDDIGVQCSRKTASYVDPTPSPKLVYDKPSDFNVGNCVNCEGRFRTRTMRLNGKLCANCYKIHESVSRTVHQLGGTFNLVVKRPGAVELILTCSQGHTWKIGM